MTRSQGNAELHPPLTAVHLRFELHRLNYRTLFGKTAHYASRADHFDFREATAYFAAGSIFALDLWEATALGRTSHWRSFVLQAGRPGELLTAVPRVEPGAQVLMQAKGARRCKFMLAWLAQLQSIVDPTTLPPDFFEARDLWMQSLPPTKHSLALLTAPLELGKSAPAGPSTPSPSQQ